MLFVEFVERNVRLHWLLVGPLARQSYLRSIVLVVSLVYVGFGFGCFVMNFSPSGKGEKIDEIYSLTVDWMDGRLVLTRLTMLSHTPLEAQSWLLDWALGLALRHNSFSEFNQRREDTITPVTIIMPIHLPLGWGDRHQLQTKQMGVFAKKNQSIASLQSSKDDSNEKVCIDDNGDAL